MEREALLLKVPCEHREEQLEDVTGPANRSAATDKSTQILKPAASKTTDETSGDLFVEKVALKTHLESDFPKIAQQSEKMQRFHEEKQQQVSGVRSAGVFGDVTRGRSDATLLHAKLKQAARCIAQLSRDKQQLIEMGNSLRAQIPPTTAKPVLPAESEKPEKDENAGEHHGRLAALEQLQYQLTSQELQYVLRQGASTKQPAPTTNSKGPTSDRADSPPSQRNKDTCGRENSRSKENIPLLRQSHGLNQGPQPFSSPSGPLLSSEESVGSLWEVWDMLDRGISPSVLSEENRRESPHKAAQQGQH